MLVSTTGKIVLEAIFLLMSFRSGYSYNLDTQFPIIYSGSKNSFFGYTTALHINRWGPLALVGAPKSNTTTFKEPVHEPGTLFRCNITTKKPADACEEVLLMKEGATETERNFDFAYRDMKDDMWLGVSLVVRPGLSENDIVTCGHRWRNQFHHRLHLVNGVCYVINGDLDADSIRKLLPLTERAMQYGKVMGRTSEYNHAHGQVGMSATFSEDGSNLILGAPGIWSWTGSIVNYAVSSNPTDFSYRNPKVPSPSYEIHFNSYFGYSVTTGRFFKSNTEFYAVGAPRDGLNNGKIYIIRLNEEQMRVRHRKRGYQLGEYFGASVLGMNLNGDAYTDLLVGAPLNSQETGGDEGIVYVYISNGNDLQKNVELTGDRKISSRFGTAISNIGDINQDGFNDFAVGAPYEDGRGAVYIYHCSSSGVNPEYAQKIEAASINSKFSGFGIHISRGIDIDKNGYPDILVGSYISSNAVLFRTRPVIHTFPEIIFAPKQINANHTACEHRGRKISCIQVDACLWYTGKHVPSSLVFQFVVKVEDYRGFFDQDMREESTSRQTMVLYIHQKICAPFQLYLRSNIKDVLTPIQVQFSNTLIPPTDSDQKFNETFPMYHPSSPINITSDIPFQTGCGEENECHSDLIISVTRTEPEEGDLITLGKISRVSVVIRVSNRGEPAYLSELLIYLPPEMPSINQDICEAGNQHNNASLVCSLGNPIHKGSHAEIHLKLDATKIPPHTKYLEIVSQAITLSTETNPDDNIETLPFHLETVSDVGITGYTLQDQLLQNDSERTSSVIAHTYIVRNHGPSPIQTIDMLMRVPYAFLTSKGRKQFVEFTGLEVDNGQQLSVPAVCEDADLNIKKIQPVIKEQGTIISDKLDEIPQNASISFLVQNSSWQSNGMTENSDVRPTVLEVDKDLITNASEHSKNIRGHHVINCNTKDMECITLRCSASPFIDSRKFSQISILFRLNFSVLNTHLDKWYQIEFATTSSISIPDDAVVELTDHPNSAQVITTILHEGPPPAPEIAPWIVFVSVGVGILLLLIIMILLVKIGFFRRKEKDKMKEMLCDAENQEHMDQEIDDTENLQ